MRDTRRAKALLPVLVLSLLLVRSALAAAPGSLTGSWRGASIGGQDGAEVAFSVRQRGDRLTVVVGLPSAAPRTIELMPGEAPGILVPVPGGMLRLFRREERPDPLQGAPLVWGRVVGDSLMLYRLEIARDGSYTLEQIVATRTGEGVALAVSTRRSGAEPESLAAELRAAS
jgi:hypothetical protein